jgi:hypothetical protein
MTRAERRQVGLGRRLGHGARGVVYEAGPGRVAKLVLEPGEPEAAARAGRLQLRHVARVLEVAEFPDFYVVYLERLRKLPRAVASELSRHRWARLLDPARDGGAPPPEAETSPLLRQVVAMGRELRRHRLEYRDAILSNLMVDAAGTLKLVDLESLDEAE